VDISRFRWSNDELYGPPIFWQLVQRLYPTPPYTKEQFLNIAVKVCPKLKETSRIIGEEVWKQRSKDVRDVIYDKLIHKVDGPKEIEGLVKTLEGELKYYGRCRWVRLSAKKG
jgi:hypothetical protein